MASKLLYCLFFLLCAVCCVQPQTQGKDYIRMMFYNVENYFDTVDDPAVDDNDFTPGSTMRWTQSRYITKRNNIFKVVVNIGGWDPPAIVGLCEIENRSTLNYLVKSTALAKYPYNIVHRDSPDPRGIDVALLFRSDMLKCVDQQFIRVGFKNTRDILYASLRTTSGDTLHVFINHWPSRSSGQKQSEPGRITAASLVRQKTDSIFRRNPMANIIITGDFNDAPSNKSLTSGLCALNDTSRAKPSTLFNLSAFKTKETTGTIKYQGRWSVFDQFIVSGGLLRGTTRTDVGNCHIFRADYLFEPDKPYQGVKLFRTYNGPAYHGGFADHLPVYIDMHITSKN